MPPHNLRERLIARTVKVIASEGLDKTTTKAIVTGTGINEAYIYRTFSHKEDLLSKTFDRLDEELCLCVIKCIENVDLRSCNIEEECKEFFMGLWEFLLGNREKCLAFIRYYYSPYFTKYSATDHKVRYAPVINASKKLFRAEANVWMIICHVLNVMLDFAIKVFDGVIENNRDTEEHVFFLIYNSIRPYFCERFLNEAEVAGICKSK